MSTNAEALSRRAFLLLGTAAAAGRFPALVAKGGEAMAERSDAVERTYHVVGVPLRAGSLYPGSEDDARALRETQLLERLKAAGCKAVDEGDVTIPNYLPHHSIPPIRSWPAPRIAWDCISDRIAPWLKQQGHVPLLIGCDCSVVVGTAQALLRAHAPDVHVLYIDGDFDDAPPDAEHAQSAASTALWLLTHDSPFWQGPRLEPSHVTVVGCSNPSRAKDARVRSLSLADVRRLGAPEAARQALANIPRSAAVILHFDTDVFQERELPSAYFPHAEGLTLAEGAQLLGALATDSRIRVIEVSEYASLRDPDRRQATALIDLLVASLSR